MANYNLSLTSTNLGVTTVNIPSADRYVFQGTLELPNIEPSATQGPGGGAGTGTGGAQKVHSQVVVTIRQNGSTIFTSTAGAQGFEIDVLCAANDIITFTLTSALAQDNQLNSLKMTLAVFESGV